MIQGKNLDSFEHSSPVSNFFGIFLYCFQVGTLLKLQHLRFQHRLNTSNNTKPTRRRNERKHQQQQGCPTTTTTAAPVTNSFNSSDYIGNTLNTGTIATTRTESIPTPSTMATTQPSTAVQTTPSTMQETTQPVMSTTKSTPNIQMIFVNCTFGGPCPPKKHKKKKHHKKKKWKATQPPKPQIPVGTSPPVPYTQPPAQVTQATQQPGATYYTPTQFSSPSVTIPEVGTPFTPPRVHEVEETEEETYGGQAAPQRPKPPKVHHQGSSPQPPGPQPQQPVPQPQLPGPSEKPPKPQPLQPKPQPPQPLPETEGGEQLPPPPGTPLPSPPQGPSGAGTANKPPQGRPGSGGQTTTTTTTCNSYKSCQGISCQLCPCISCIPVVGVNCQATSCSVCPGVGCIPAVPMIPVLPMVPLVQVNGAKPQVTQTTQETVVSQEKQPPYPGQKPVGPPAEQMETSHEEGVQQQEQPFNQGPTPKVQPTAEQEQEPTSQVAQTEGQQQQQRPSPGQHEQPNQSSLQPQQQKRPQQQQQNQGQEPQQQQQQRPSNQQYQQSSQQKYHQNPQASSQQQQPDNQTQQAVPTQQSLNEKQPQQQSTQPVEPTEPDASSGEQQEVSSGIQQQSANITAQQQSSNVTQQETAQQQQQQYAGQNNSQNASASMRPAPAQQQAAPVQQYASPYGGRNQTEANGTYASGEKSNSQIYAASQSLPPGQPYSQNYTQGSLVLMHGKKKKKHKHKIKYPFILKHKKRPKLSHHKLQQWAHQSTTINQQQSANQSANQSTNQSLGSKVQQNQTNQQNQSVNQYAAATTVAPTTIPSQSPQSQYQYSRQPVTTSTPEQKSVTPTGGYVNSHIKGPLTRPAVGKLLRPSGRVSGDDSPTENDKRPGPTRAPPKNQGSLEEMPMLNEVDRKPDQTYNVTWEPNKTAMNESKPTQAPAAPTFKPTFTRIPDFPSVLTTPKLPVSGSQEQGEDDSTEPPYVEGLSRPQYRPTTASTETTTRNRKVPALRTKPTQSPTKAESSFTGAGAAQHPATTQGKQSTGSRITHPIQEKFSHSSQQTQPVTKNVSKTIPYNAERPTSPVGQPSYPTESQGVLTTRPTIAMTTSRLYQSTAKQGSPGPSEDMQTESTSETPYEGTEKPTNKLPSSYATRFRTTAKNNGQNTVQSYPTYKQPPTSAQAEQNNTQSSEVLSSRPTSKYGTAAYNVDQTTNQTYPTYKQQPPTSAQAEQNNTQSSAVLSSRPTFKYGTAVNNVAQINKQTYPTYKQQPTSAQAEQNNTQPSEVLSSRPTSKYGTAVNNVAQTTNQTYPTFKQQPISTQKENNYTQASKTGGARPTSRYGTTAKTAKGESYPANEEEESETDTSDLEETVPTSKQAPETEYKYGTTNRVTSGSQKPSYPTDREQTSSQKQPNYTIFSPKSSEKQTAPSGPTQKITYGTQKQSYPTNRKASPSMKRPNSLLYPGTERKKPTSKLQKTTSYKTAKTNRKPATTQTQANYSQASEITSGRPTSKQGYPSSSQYDVTAKVGSTAAKQQYQTGQQSYAKGQRPTYPQTTSQQEPSNNQTEGVTEPLPSQPVQKPAYATGQRPTYPQTTSQQEPSNNQTEGVTEPSPSQPVQKPAYATGQRPTYPQTTSQQAPNNNQTEGVTEPLPSQPVQKPAYATGQRPTYPQTTSQQAPNNNETEGGTEPSPSQPVQQPSMAAEQYPYQTTTTQKPYVTAAGTQEQKVPDNEDNDEEKQVNRPTSVPRFNPDITTVRPKMDQAALNPQVNDSRLQDFRTQQNNTTTQQQTTQSPTSSSPLLSTVFPASPGGAMNTTAPTPSSIRTEPKTTQKQPSTTKERGTPLKNYPTVFPGLAFPTTGKSEGNETILATVQPQSQNQNAVTANLPPNNGNQTQNAYYGPTNSAVRPTGYPTANAYYLTTVKPSQGSNIKYGAPTARQSKEPTVKYGTPTARQSKEPTVKYGTPNETTAQAEQKDDFAAQTSYSPPDAQQSNGLPHQVFNPEHEMLQAQEDEAERIRLLSVTTPAPVTNNKDSDEDINAPDNANKDQDDDWHGLRYGPLALPPAFKESISRKGNEQKDSKGLSDEGELQEYGAYQTTSRINSKTKAVSALNIPEEPTIANHQDETQYSEQGNKGDEQPTFDINPLYVNDTSIQTTTKRPTTAKDVVTKKATTYSYEHRTTAKPTTKSATVTRVPTATRAPYTTRIRTGSAKTTARPSKQMSKLTTLIRTTKKPTTTKEKETRETSAPVYQTTTTSDETETKAAVFKTTTESESETEAPSYQSTTTEEENAPHTEEVSTSNNKMTPANGKQTSTQTTTENEQTQSTGPKTTTESLSTATTISNEEPPPENATHGVMAPPERPSTLQTTTTQTTKRPETNKPMNVDTFTPGNLVNTGETTTKPTYRPATTKGASNTRRPVTTKARPTNAQTTQKVATTNKKSSESPTKSTAESTTDAKTESATTKASEEQTTANPESLVDKIYDIFHRIVGINAQPTYKTNPTTQPSQTTTASVTRQPSQPQATATTSEAAKKTEMPQEIQTTTEKTEMPQAVQTTTEKPEMPQAVQTTTEKTEMPQEIQTTTEKTEMPQAVQTTAIRTGTTESSKDLAEMLLNSKPTSAPKETTKTDSNQVTTSPATKTKTESPWKIEITEASTTEKPEVYTTTEKPNVETTTEQTEMPQAVQTTTEKTEMPQAARTTATRTGTTESSEENTEASTTEKPEVYTTTEKPQVETTTEQTDFGKTTTTASKDSKSTEEASLYPTERPETTSTKTTTERSWKTTTDSQESTSWKTTTESSKAQEDEKDIDRIIANPKTGSTTEEVEWRIQAVFTTSEPAYEKTTTTERPSTEDNEKGTTTTERPSTKVDRITWEVEGNEKEATTTERPSTKVDRITWEVEDNEKEATTTERPQTTTKAYDNEYKTQKTETTEAPEIEYSTANVKTTTRRPSTQVDRITWEVEDNNQTTTTEAPQTTTSSNDIENVEYKTQKTETTERPETVYTSSNVMTTDKDEKENTAQGTTTRNDVYNGESAATYTESVTTTKNPPLAKTDNSRTRLPVSTSNAELPASRTTHEYRVTSANATKTEAVKTEAKLQPTTRPISKLTTEKETARTSYESMISKTQNHEESLQDFRKPEVITVIETKTEESRPISQSETNQSRITLAQIIKTTTEKPEGITGPKTNPFTYKSEPITVQKPTESKVSNQEVLSEEKPYVGGAVQPSAYEKEASNLNKATTASTTTSRPTENIRKIDYNEMSEKEPNYNAGDVKNVSVPTGKASSGEPTRPDVTTQNLGGSISPGNSYMGKYLLGIQKWYNKYVRKIEQENLTFYPETAIDYKDFDDLRQEMKEEKQADKDDGYDPWRAMKEYYDAYISEIEEWEVKYGRKKGAQESVNKPNAEPIVLTTLKPKVTWNTPAAVAVGKQNETNVDIPSMYGRPATEQPSAATTTASESKYPTNTYPKVTPKPSTADLDRIFANLATWKRPTEPPMSQIPPNIPSKGDDGEIVYTPFLPDAPTRIPKTKAPVTGGKSTADLDAIFAKIATWLKPTTKPTTSQTTESKNNNNETVFITPKLPPAPSVSSTKTEPNEGDRRPSTPGVTGQAGNATVSTTKPITNQGTNGKVTYYPEAESNTTTTTTTAAPQATTTPATTTTANKFKQQTQPITLHTTETPAKETIPPETTTAQPIETTTRLPSTKPTEYEIVPPTETQGSNQEQGVKQPPKNQTSTEAPEQPITEKVDTIPANQNQDTTTSQPSENAQTTTPISSIETTTTAPSTTTTTTEPGKAGESNENDKLEQEGLPQNPVTSYEGQKTSNPAAAVTTKPENDYGTSTAEKEEATTTQAPQTTATVSMTTTAAQATSTASNQDTTITTAAIQEATTTAIPETTATVSMTTTAAAQATSTASNQETATTTASSQETTTTTERPETTPASVTTTASSDESVVPTRLPSTTAAEEIESTTKQQNSNQNPSTVYPGTAKQGSQNVTTSSNTYTTASDTQSTTSGTTAGSQTTETASQTTSQNAETTTAYKPTQSVTEKVPNTESYNETTTTRPAEDTTTSAETSSPITTQTSETATPYQNYKTESSTTTSKAVNNAAPTRPVGTTLTSTESNSAKTSQNLESTTSNQTSQGASESTSKAPTRPVGTTKAITDTETSSSTTSASTEDQTTTDTSAAEQPSENSGTGTTTKPTKATVVVFTNEKNGGETTTSNNQATTTANPYPSYQETTTAPYNSGQSGTDQTSTTSTQYPGAESQYQETTTTVTEKPKEGSTSEPGVSVEEPNLNTTTAPNTYPQQKPAQVAATAGRYPGTENPYPASAPQITGNQQQVGQTTSEEPKTTTAPAGVSVEEPSTVKPQTARQQPQSNNTFTQTLYTSQRLRYYTWYEEVESNDTDSDVTQTMTPQPTQRVNNGQSSNQSNLITSAAPSNQNNVASAASNDQDNAPPQAPSNQAPAAPSYQPSNNGSIYLEGKEDEELVYEPNPYAAATTTPRPEITTTALPEVYQALAQTTTTTKSPYIVATTANEPSIAQAQGPAQQITDAQNRPSVNTNATVMPTKALPEAYQALAETTTTKSPYIVATNAQVAGSAQPQRPGQQVTAAQNSPQAQANTTSSKAPVAETTQSSLDYLEGKETDETIMETFPPTLKQEPTTSSTPPQPNPPAQPQGYPQYNQGNTYQYNGYHYPTGNPNNNETTTTAPPLVEFGVGGKQQDGYLEGKDDSEAMFENELTTTPHRESTTSTSYPTRYGTTQSPTSQAGYGSAGSQQATNVTATAAQTGTSGQQGGYLEEKEDNEAVYGVAATPPRLGETTQARPGDTTTSTQAETTTNWSKYQANNVATAAQPGPTTQQGGYLEEKEESKAVYGIAATPARVGETTPQRPSETTTAMQTEATTNGPKYPANNATYAAQLPPVEPTPDTNVTTNVAQTQAAASNNAGYLEGKEDDEVMYGNNENQGIEYMAQSSRYPSAYDTSKAQTAPQNGSQSYYGSVTQGDYYGNGQQSGMDNVQGYETTTTTVATTTALPLVTTTIATAARTTQYPYRYDNSNNNSNNNNNNTTNDKQDGVGSDTEAETESENANEEEKTNGDLTEESKIEQSQGTTEERQDASTSGQPSSTAGQSGPQSGQSETNQTGSTQSINDLESQDTSQSQSDNGPPTPPPYYPQETTQPSTQQYTTTPAYGNQWPNFVATTTKAPPVYQGNGVEYMEGKDGEEILYRTTTPPPIYQQGLQGEVTTKPPIYGEPYNPKDTNQDEASNEKQSQEPYQNEAGTAFPTTKPTSASTTAHAGVSVEEPTTDGDIAVEGNESISMNKAYNPNQYNNNPTFAQQQETTTTSNVVPPYRPTTKYSGNLVQTTTASEFVMPWMEGKNDEVPYSQYYARPTTRNAEKRTTIAMQPYGAQPTGSRNQLTGNDVANSVNNTQMTQNQGNSQQTASNVEAVKASETASSANKGGTSDTTTQNNGGSPTEQQSYYGHLYANGYPYNDQKSYQQYLDEFYASFKDKDLVADAKLRTASRDELDSRLESDLTQKQPTPSMYPASKQNTTGDDDSKQTQYVTQAEQKYEPTESRLQTDKNDVNVSQNAIQYEAQAEQKYAPTEARLQTDKESANLSQNELPVMTEAVADIKAPDEALATGKQYAPTQAVYQGAKLVTANANVRTNPETAKYVTQGAVDLATSENKQDRPTEAMYGTEKQDNAADTMVDQNTIKSIGSSNEAQNENEAKYKPTTSAYQGTIGVPDVTKATGADKQNKQTSETSDRQGIDSSAVPEENAQQRYGPTESMISATDAATQKENIATTIPQTNTYEAQPNAAITDGMGEQRAVAGADNGGQNTESFYKAPQQAYSSNIDEVSAQQRQQFVTSFNEALSNDLAQGRSEMNTANEPTTKYGPTEAKTQTTAAQNGDLQSTSTQTSQGNAQDDTAYAQQQQRKIFSPTLSNVGQRRGEAAKPEPTTKPANATEKKATSSNLIRVILLPTTKSTGENEVDNENSTDIIKTSENPGENSTTSLPSEEVDIANENTANLATSPDVLQQNTTASSPSSADSSDQEFYLWQPTTSKTQETATDTTTTTTKAASPSVGVTASQPPNDVNSTQPATTSSLSPSDSGSVSQDTLLVSTSKVASVAMQETTQKLVQTTQKQASSAQPTDKSSDLNSLISSKPEIIALGKAMEREGSSPSSTSASSSDQSNNTTTVTTAMNPDENHKNEGSPIGATDESIKNVEVPNAATDVSVNNIGVPNGAKDENVKNEDVPISSTDESAKNDGVPNGATTPRNEASSPPTQPVNKAEIEQNGDSEYITNMAVQQGKDTVPDEGSGNATAKEEAVPTVGTKPRTQTSPTVAPTTVPTTIAIPAQTTTLTPVTTLSANTSVMSGNNGSSGINVIRPVTGSVILTERVSYNDLIDDDDTLGVGDNNNQPSISYTAVPKGPSAYYGTDDLNKNNEAVAPAEKTSASESLEPSGDLGQTRPFTNASSSSNAANTSSPETQPPTDKVSSSQSIPTEAKSRSYVDGSAANIQNSYDEGQESYQQAALPSQRSQVESQTSQVESRTSVQDQIVGHPTSSVRVSTSSYDSFERQSDSEERSGVQASSPTKRVEVPTQVIENSMNVQTSDYGNTEANKVGDIVNSYIGNAGQEQTAQEPSQYPDLQSAARNTLPNGNEFKTQAPVIATTTTEGSFTVSNHDNADANIAKSRVPRTIPSTLLPPITSPLTDEAPAVAQAAVNQPTVKTSGPTYYVNPVTGDIMKLNNKKLGIEQVESGDYLGSPPEEAELHQFTPSIPEELPNNGTTNGTLHNLFKEIVGPDSDEVVDASQNDTKEGEELTNKVDNQVIKDTDSEDDQDNQDDQDTFIADRTNSNSQSVNQNSESTHQDLLTIDQLVKPNDQELESPDHNKSPIVENIEPTTDKSHLESSDQESQSASDYDPQAITKDANQSDKAAVDNQINLADASTQSQSASEFDPQDIAKDVDQSNNATVANQIDQSDESKQSVTSSDTVTGSQRDEIEGDDNRERNDDEFTTVRSDLDDSGNEFDDPGLVDLLLHPDNLPPQTVAEDIDDTTSDFIEANPMVVHDDLDR
eukprot:Seg2316.2 transcript_id=Seg2316.2/GoldUCD/mRNA.D3Y31 product="hypothetical protein" protein_id=Seg2316.2/GoldUCD/D3Y31